MLIYKDEQAYEAQYVGMKTSHVNLANGVESSYSYCYRLAPESRQIEVRLSQLGLDLMYELGHDPSHPSGKAVNELLLYKFSTAGKDDVLSITPEDVVKVFGNSRRRG